MRKIRIIDWPDGPVSIIPLYDEGPPTIDDMIRYNNSRQPVSGNKGIKDLLTIREAIEQDKNPFGVPLGDTTSQGNRRPKSTQQSYTTPQLGSGGTSSRRPQRPGGGSEGRVRVGYIHYPRKPTPKEVKRFLDNGDKIDPPRPIWQLQTFREQQEEQEVILQMIQRQQQKIGGKVPFDGK